MFWKVMRVVLIVATALWCVGCRVVDSGPKSVEAVTAVAVEAAKTVLAQYQGKAGQTEVVMKGALNDPRYRAQVFAGSGVYVDVLLSLEGAEVSAEVKGGGKE